DPSLNRHWKIHGNTAGSGMSVELETRIPRQMQRDAAGPRLQIPASGLLALNLHAAAARMRAERAAHAACADGPAAGVGLNITKDIGQRDASGAGARFEAVGKARNV